MEEDYPSKNCDGKLPILDLKVWIGENQLIMYQFYRKDMASRLLMMSRSAMPHKMKINVLTQEAIRILRNCSGKMKWKEVANILTDFCVRMKISGYSERHRLNIIMSALKGWARQKEADRSGAKPMYRDKEYKKVERRKEKERKKKQWYNQGNDNCTFPIFCPSTPGSKLFKRWKGVAESLTKASKGRVNAKIVEQGGVPLKHLLCKSAPKENPSCDDGDCRVCSSSCNKRVVCRKMAKGGTGYDIQCIRCKQEGKCSLYHGETYRTLYTRIGEHFQGDPDNTSSALRKHNSKFHPGEEPSFDIKPVGYYSAPLSRQINEGVRINNSKSSAGRLMNSKSEFRQGEVPRVIIMNGIQ